MRRFVGIDAGVLDDDLFFVMRDRGAVDLLRRCAALRLFLYAHPEKPSVEMRVEIASPRDFDPRDAFDRAKILGDFLGDLPRSALQPLGQLETHRRSQFAQVEFWRFLQRNLERDAVAFPDVASEGFAEAVGEYVIHGSSMEKWLSIRGGAERRQRHGP